jgi:SAM-dependent methyltransferase
MTSAVTSSSSSSSSSQINPTAQNGFSKAAQYDQHRPSFPAHSVSILLDGVRVANKPQATVVDLAAGTGKFTELLAARDEGYEIIAVEPHADMRKVLEEKRLERVSVRDGLSTDMKSLEDESVDAVIAAQVGYAELLFFFFFLFSFFLYFFPFPLSSRLHASSLFPCISDFIR